MHARVCVCGQREFKQREREISKANEWTWLCPWIGTRRNAYEPWINLIESRRQGKKGKRKVINSLRRTIKRKKRVRKLKAANQKQSLGAWQREFWTFWIQSVHMSDCFADEFGASSYRTYQLLLSNWFEYEAKDKVSDGQVKNLLLFTAWKWFWKEKKRKERTQAQRRINICNYFATRTTLTR
jgi:hypothetical protein